MKRLAVVALLLSGNAVASPFCVVSPSGAMCTYSDYSYCQQTAKSLGGTCVANPEQYQQPLPPSAPARSNYFDVNKAVDRPDIAGAAQRGMESGQRMRIQREEHAAQMELMKAETEAVKRRGRAETNTGYWVMYQCPDGNGGTAPSGVPAKGCVVDFVEAY
jgi:hypothetical protein